MEEITRNEVWFGYDDLETSEDSITIDFPNVSGMGWKSYDHKHQQEYEVNYESKNKKTNY